MLIAHLERLEWSSIDKNAGKEILTAYAATDPFDGEMLTDWYNTITEVDDALEALDDTVAWGLNTAAYAGESDVPTRPSKE